jgi:2-polyprenyl-3-methyl-5-hydroxy-6-metoxy-1,4-benzoquinol methylase
LHRCAADVNAIDTAVTEQYLSYPYPPRDPEDERRRLHTTWLGNLARVNGIFWGGRRDPNRLRILDAGCGTGDAAVYLAHQAPGAEVVALDASEASLAVAERRAEVRGLHNIRFVHAPLEDLPGLGPFDYVVCSGVLHHLDDPAAGLAALVSVLALNGGLGLMLYARYGRTPIYEVQDLLRLLTPGEPLDDRVDAAHEVLATLPARHFWKLGGLEHEFLDIAAGPAGIVDLLLHARDRAYTMPEIHAFLGEQGLALRELEPPLLYRPEHYPLADGVRRRLRGLDVRARHAVAELLNGRMTTHKFYAMRASVTPNVPSLETAPSRLRPVVYEPALAGYFAGLADTDQPFHLESPFGFSIDLELTRADAALLRAIDGRRRLDEVFGAAARALRAGGLAVSTERLMERWKTVYMPLSACGYAGCHWAD